MPISIHALREEGDTQLTLLEQTTGIISIHALREEGDQSCASGTAYAKNDFYPRPPRGGRLAPRVFKPRAVSISIHALREEGDNLIAVQQFKLLLFLSTPSARRATIISRRPPVCKDISIHALREEGDFVSESWLSAHYAISIHALREEGDPAHPGLQRQGNNFYPRPPRGGRPVHLFRNLFVKIISIHALREEGDAFKNFPFLRCKLFLSTPSARRATAKTETKSLFSYKLYNILHEFRRALIYNGSKNDPNHAKRLENPVRRCRKDAENSPFAPGRETQNNSRPSCSKGG